MKLRAAVIGCGMIGSEFADDPRATGIYSHAEAYVSCEATELVALCDVDPAKLQKSMARWGVGAGYRDAVALLSEQRPDIVSVCAPDATHATLVRQSLMSEGVQAVVAEKPLALNLEEAKELAKLAAERQVVLAVNYMRRYSAGHRAVRDAIRDGAIGDITHVNGCYTKGIKHNGSHWFDLARFLAGEIVEVIATGGPGADRSDDPTVDVSIKFASGATGHLAGCDADDFSIFELDLIGSRGRLRIVDSGHNTERQHVEDSPYYSGYRTLSAPVRTANDMRDTTLRLVEDVIVCLRQAGRRPWCSGDDGVAALAIAEAACTSAHARPPHAVTV